MVRCIYVNLYVDVNTPDHKACIICGAVSPDRYRCWSERSRPDTGLASQIDEELALADHFEALDGHHGEWIRSTRHALGWVLADLGRKLCISKQALARLEERERSGNISVQKLEELARSMDCHFVYGFIPNKPMATMATDLYCRQTDAQHRHRTMPRPQ